MPLDPFVARHVNPGEPLTAQAWNEVVDGVQGVYEYLQATLHTVRVHITTPGIDLSTVRVTAVKAGEPPVEAVRPVAPDTHHILTGLTPGAYSLLAEAPGYSSASGSINVGNEGDSEIDLVPVATEIPMPSVFGLPLSQARAVLNAKSITVARLFDFAGHDLPPLTPGPEYDLAPVLVQVPPAGTLVSAAGTSVQLAVAVPPKLDTSVAVPSLAGLTLVEAKKALEGLGLVLGKVRTLNKGNALRNLGGQ